MKKKYLIKENDINLRLDKWFKKNVCDVPQSLIEKNIRKNKIKINNKKEKSSYKLRFNDEISLFNLSIKPDILKKKKFIYIPTKKDLDFSSNIFIEDNENFAVINKPSGIPVQSGTKSKKNILDLLRKTKEFNNCQPYTVHRLDKETTGVLIVAKNRKYAQLFTSLFRVRKMHKTYLCIVVGEMKEKKGTLVDTLYHYEKDRKVLTKAITHFSLLDSNNKYSFLELIPSTGRKHQIRKQLLLRGLPVLGDSKYRMNFKKYNKKEQLMLHAYKISFMIDSIKYKFSADLPILFKENLKEKYLKSYG